MKVFLSFLTITLTAVQADFREKQAALIESHPCGDAQYGANCQDPYLYREFCDHDGQAIINNNIPRSICAYIELLPLLFQEGDYCGRCVDIGYITGGGGSDGSVFGLETKEEEETGREIPIFENLPTSPPAPVAPVAPVAPTTGAPSGSSLPSMVPSDVPSSLPNLVPSSVPSSQPSGSFLPSEVPTVSDGTRDVVLSETSAPVSTPTSTIPEFILPTDAPDSPTSITDSYGTSVGTMYTLGPIFTKNILSDEELEVIAAEVMTVMNKYIVVGDRATIVYSVRVTDQTTVDSERRLLRRQRKLQDEVKEILLLMNVQGFVHPDAGGDYKFFNVIFTAVESNLLELQSVLNSRGIRFEYEECKLQGTC